MNHPPLALLATGAFFLNIGIFSALLLRVRVAESRLQQIHEKTEIMMDDLRKIETLKNEFISTVSHELRTPLTAIGGFTKLMSAGDAGPVNPTQAEFLKIIETNVGRLTDLINDILDVDKIEAGSFQVRKDEVDLVPILRDIYDSFLLGAKKKDLGLSLDLKSKNLFVMGDPQRLEQIFSNLISNAIKYTPKGSVAVKVEEYERAVMIRVSDTGIGISKEDHENIFQKFFRTEASQALPESGTGLGLTIVKSLVEAHHGSIEVEGALGRGTTFTITFPLLRRELDQTAESLHEGLHEKAIWVVDANEADASLTHRLLFEASSYYSAVINEVNFFKNLTQVLEALVSPDVAKPSVVICDPESDEKDFSLLRVLREKLGNSIPIVILSRLHLAKESFEQGANSYLEKPIEREAFLFTLKDVFRQVGSRILLVEADSNLRLLMKHALEKRGFEVDDLEHGRSVFNRLLIHEYDLIIVDEELADVPIRELGFAIRKSPTHKNVTLCIATQKDVRELEPYNFSISKARSIDETVEELVKRVGRE